MIRLGDLVYTEQGLYYVLSVQPNEPEPTNEYFVRLCGPITGQNTGACRAFVSGTHVLSSKELNQVLCWQNIISNEIDDDVFFLDDPSLLGFTTLLVEQGDSMFIDDCSQDLPDDYWDILRWYGKGLSGNVYHTRLRTSTPIDCCYQDSTNDIIQQLPYLAYATPTKTNGSFSDVRQGDVLLHENALYFVLDTFIRRIGQAVSVGIILYGTIRPDTIHIFRQSRSERRLIPPLSVYHLEEYRQNISPYRLGMIDSNNSVTFSSMPHMSGRVVYIALDGSIGITQTDLFDRLQHLRYSMKLSSQ
jgi:hypothetical protein